MNTETEKTTDNGIAPLLDKITDLEAKITNLEKQVSDTTKLNRELLNRKQKEETLSKQSSIDNELFHKFLLEEN